MNIVSAIFSQFSANQHIRFEVEVECFQHLAFKHFFLIQKNYLKVILITK